MCRCSMTTSNTSSIITGACLRLRAPCLWLRGRHVPHAIPALPLAVVRTTCSCLSCCCNHCCRHHHRTVSCPCLLLYLCLVIDHHHCCHRHHHVVVTFHALYPHYHLQLSVLFVLVWHVIVTTAAASIIEQLVARACYYSMSCD